MPDSPPLPPPKKNTDTGPYLGDLQDILRYVRGRLALPVSVPSQMSNPTDTNGFAADLAIARRLLPSRYYAPYVDILARTVTLADAQIAQIQKQTTWRKKAKKQAVLNKLAEIFGTLAAPIVQLNSQAHETELKAYLAVASNLFQRFMMDSKIARINADEEAFPRIDPLGFFTDATTGSEPAIWSPSRELPVALVSKPANQMNCLPLWVLDGHEVGGHGIYSHLAGFDQEIATALVGAVSQKAATAGFKPRLQSVSGHLVELIAPLETSLTAGPKSLKSLGVSELYRHIVNAYSQELAADVAGILNCGPMFVDGLIVYLAARRKDGRLSHTSPLVDKQRLNVYPADLLRALTAIEAVGLLNLKNGATWQKLLRQRLLAACGGELPDHFSFVAEQGIFKITVPREDIEALVPCIADALLNASLPCLADRSLSAVLTWTDADENIVEQVSRRLLKPVCNLDDLTDVEARHIASAALQALERSAGKATARTLTDRIQNNGLAILKSFYLEQCILCPVPLYGKVKRGGKDGQLWNVPDLLQRVRSFTSPS